jgi:hypothetical protein
VPKQECPNKFWMLLHIIYANCIYKPGSILVPVVDAVSSAPVVTDDLVSAATMPTLMAEDGQLYDDCNYDHDMPTMR